MKAIFTKFDTNDNWVTGEVGEYRFSAKLFDEKSSYGINKGRVSKLYICGNNVDIAHYDRGWDVKPKKEYESYYNAVMELLENSPKRFN